MADFDRSEGLDVKFWIESTQPLQKFQIPFLLERGVQSAYHVHLRNSEWKRISYDLGNFVNRIFKRVRVALFGGKRAELAGQDTNVRVVDVTVVDISRVIAVLSFAHHVGNHSKSVKIVRTIQSKRVWLRNPLRRLNLFCNRP